MLNHIDIEKWLKQSTIGALEPLLELFPSKSIPELAHRLILASEQVSDIDVQEHMRNLIL